MRPYFEKNLSQKRSGGVAQNVGPEFKPHYRKKKKTKKTACMYLANNSGFTDLRNSARKPSI
jgi:hypothetical protein